MIKRNNSYNSVLFFLYKNFKFIKKKKNRTHLHLFVPLFNDRCVFLDAYLILSKGTKSCQINLKFFRMIIFHFQGIIIFLVNLVQLYWFQKNIFLFFKIKLFSAKVFVAMSPIFFENTNFSLQMDLSPATQV